MGEGSFWQRKEVSVPRGWDRGCGRCAGNRPLTGRLPGPRGGWTLASQRLPGPPAQPPWPHPTPTSLFSLVILLGQWLPQRRSPIRLLPVSCGPAGGRAASSPPPSICAALGRGGHTGSPSPRQPPPRVLSSPATGCTVPHKVPRHRPEPPPQEVTVSGAGALGS